MTNLDKIKERINLILNLCSHQQQVSFALYCARDAVKTSGLNDKAVLSCLDLVEEWLKDPSKVSNQELEEAAYTDAYTDACYASSAAYNAHTAANVAYNAAYSAAHNAANAAYVASNAAYNVVLEKAYEKYYTQLLNIANYTAFDKLIHEVVT